MTDTSKPRTVRLTDYLIEQGAGADAAAKAAIFARIHNGALPAFITVHPASLPAGTSTASVLRHAMSAANEPHEVSVQSHAEAMAEISNGALDWETDRTVLDRISVRVRDSEPAPAAVVRTIPRGAANKANILKAIKALGYTATRLPQRTNGKSGPKDEVRRHPLTTGIAKSSFTKAWQELRDEGLIKGG